MRTISTVGEDIVHGYTLLNKAVQIQRQYEALWRELEALVSELAASSCSCGCAERLRQQLDAIRAMEAFQGLTVLDEQHIEEALSRIRIER